MTKNPIHPPSEDLFAYRDGELAPEKRSFVEAHVLGCSACRSMMDQVSALESEMRRGPDAAPPGYLEHLHEALRARLASSRPAAPENVPVPPPRGREAPTKKTEDRVSGDGNRRGKVIREAGRIEEAPRLPWGAILSTAGAGAAVLVVAVILVRGGFAPKAVHEKATRGTEVSQAPPAGTGAPESVGRRMAQVPPPAPSRDEAKQKKDERFQDQKLAKTGSASGQTENETRSVADEMAHRQDEPRAQAPQAATPEGLTAPPAAMKSLAAGEETPYQALLRKHRLPPVWSEALVPATALEAAAPELRFLYVTGKAGADSARVRLYLAEADRLHYTPGDSTLYDEIAKHYRRAIRLAGSDTETVRVATERLRSLPR